MTRRKPRPLGRPPAADSARRRREILAAARQRFATHGYTATTLSAVARDAGVTLAAVYHYFQDKTELYEAVFTDAIESMWGRVHDILDSASDDEAGIESLVAVLTQATAEIDEAEPATSLFLTTVPIEATRHSELAHLVARRAEVQERQIRALVTPAFLAGRLPAFSSVDTAVAGIRMLVMGWGMENYYQRSRADEHAQAAVEMLRHLTIADTEPATPPRRRIAKA